MRLILHVGTAKTGTTALQETLLSSSSVARKQGVLYPEPAHDVAHHGGLVALVVPFDRMPRDVVRRGGGDPRRIERMGHEAWEHVRVQVKRARPEVMILSSEYFFGLGESNLRDLATRLRALTQDIEVVCYVRDPASYYLSMMQQRVKASHFVNPPSSFKMRAKVCLSRHLDVFDGRVQVRSADRAALVGGDVVSDFATAFLPQLRSEVLRAPGPDLRALNESMSAEAMCIMQELRRHGWPEENNHFAKESSRINETLNALREDEPQTQARLRPDIRAMLVERHRADLDFLRERFGIEFPNLQAPVDDAPSRRPPAGWTSGDLREIVDVDPASISRVLYLTMKELATPRPEARRR